MPRRASAAPAGGLMLRRVAGVVLVVQACGGSDWSCPTSNRSHAYAGGTGAAGMAFAGWSAREKIGQMTQLNIDAVLVPGSTASTTGPRLDPEAVRRCCGGEDSVGSFLNSPFSGSGAGNAATGRSGYTAVEWRALITDLQTQCMDASPHGMPMLCEGRRTRPCLSPLSLF